MKKEEQQQDELGKKYLMMRINISFAETIILRLTFQWITSKP
jgi:hypothetical protein